MKKKIRPGAPGKKNESFTACAVFVLLSLFAGTGGLYAQDGDGGGDAPPGLVDYAPSGDTAEDEPEANPDAPENDQSAARRERLMDTGALRSTVTDEAPPALASINIFDSDVSLFLSGFWKGAFTAKWGISTGPLGTSVAANDSPFLFTQEADLNLALWIRERWFVETSFEEDYAVNTYRAGYQGKPGEAVQYVGIGNKGLDFPEFPYLDLGGDSASSFGLYGRFGGGPLQIHSLVRWDDAVREERTFVGGRERTFSYLEASATIRGVSFVLPDENIQSEIIVYFEDNDGALADGSGRRWREALPSEYAVSSRLGLVELRSSPDVRVAVSYSGGYSMGDYVTSGTFLGDAQAVFSEVSLKGYPQPGGSADKPAVISIAGRQSLVIYEKGTFSPFERQSRYNAPYSTAESVMLIDSSDGERVPGFDAGPLAETSFYSDLPLYVSEETGDLITQERRVYEIIRDDVRTDPRDPLARWPLALDSSGKPWNYQVYLAGGESFAPDVRLRFTNYGASTDYNIGTDVVPGSVKVLRAGLDDPNFSFDSTSGTVRLQTPATFNETIRISFLKRSAERRNGSLAAGLGAVYSVDQHFRAEGALGLRWNLAADSFSEEGSSSPGTVGFGGRTVWSYENLNADLRTGFAFVQPDTTGLYRVAGMEGSEQILPLSESASFISEAPGDLSGNQPPLVSGLTMSGRAPLVYRAYRNTDALGTVTLMNIDWSGASVVNGKDGPYAARDPSLGGEILAAEFSLGGDKNWTGFQSPLGDGSALAEARTVEVPFRFYNFSGDTSKVRVVIEFGDLADKDRGGYENPALTVDAELYPPPQQGFHEQPRLVTINLDDADRRKLGNAKYLRLLVINDGAAGVSGRVLLAPPIVRGAKFAPLSVVNGEVKGNFDNKVSTLETLDESLGARYPDTIKRLHPDGARQRVLNVSWEDLPAGASSVGAGGRLGRIPFSSYKTLSFFVKPPALTALTGGETFDFLVLRGRSSLGKDSETALRARIPVQTLNSISGGNWTEVELRYGGGANEVYAGGQRIDVPLYYNPQALRDSGSANDDAYTGGDYTADSAYIMALISKGGQELAKAGEFRLDEVILLDGVPEYSLNAGGSFRWHSDKAMISVNGLEILGGPAFETALESGARGDPWDEYAEPFYAVVTRSRAGLRLFSVQLDGNVAFSSGSNRFWWNAGHKISKSLGPLSLFEAFFVDPYSVLWNHEAEISVSGLVSSLFHAGSDFASSQKNRVWRASLGMASIPGTPLRFSIGADANWSNTESSDGEAYSDYGKVWADSWQNMIPDNGALADRRRLGGRFETGLSTKPLGLSLALDGRSSADRAANSTESAGNGALGFPFSAGGFSGSFRVERAYRRFIFYKGPHAGYDLQKFAETFGESSAVYGAIPFYSLFDPGLGAVLRESLGESDSSGLVRDASFSDKYLFSLQLPETFGLPSLFTPRSLEAHIDRNLNQKLDTQTDTLGTGGVLRFSSINMFGAFGAVPLFKFYENDEYNTSLSAAIAIPRGENTSWRVQAGQIFIFYGFKGATLQFEDLITVLANGWTGTFKLDWVSPAKKSLLGTLYSWFFSKFSGQSSWPALRELALVNFERLRQESLELIFDRTGDSGGLTLSFQHKSIVRILGRLNLEVFARLDVSRSEITETSSFIGTIGTSLNVSY
ncbi:MAG: hypothetical protein LBD86_01140 [Spirochaetaceae bacterium]|nr:hypothetical protein [Spirochaetaceae bacterium]